MDRGSRTRTRTRLGYLAVSLAFVAFWIVTFWPAIQLWWLTQA